MTDLDTSKQETWFETRHPSPALTISSTEERSTYPEMYPVWISRSLGILSLEKPYCLESDAWIQKTGLLTLDIQGKCCKFGFAPSSDACACLSSSESRETAIRAGSFLHNDCSSSCAAKGSVTSEDFGTQKSLFVLFL